MKGVFVFFLLTVAFSHCSVFGDDDDPKIKDHKIYKIANKVDSGVLTFNSGSGSNDDFQVKLQSWNDAAGQKWKSKQPALAKSFEFKPTSNEQGTLNVDESGSDVLVKLSSTSDTKYWYVRFMGEGSFQIKNFKTQSCVSSQGLNRKVKLASCDNSPAQQWIFTPL